MIATQRVEIATMSEQLATSQQEVAQLSVEKAALLAGFGREQVRTIAVDDAWGSAVDPNKVEAALRAHPEAKLLAFVHAETSTGVLQPVDEIAAAARRAKSAGLVSHSAACASSTCRSISSRVSHRIWRSNATISNPSS